MTIASRLNDKISRSPNQFRDCYVPVFKVTCDGTPYHAGTAFGIELNSTRYMVTAAHVLERDEDNPCDSADDLFVSVDGELTQIERFERQVFRSGSQRLPPNSLLDLVLILPTDIDLGRVFPRVFTMKDVHRPPLRSQLYVAACGFPSTKNGLKSSSTILSQMPVGYFGRVSDSGKCRKAGFDSKSHFAFDLLLKKTYTSRLKEVKAPKPHGISGGPVFVVHDFDRPKRFMKPKLRGVIIWMAPKQQCFVCVDLFAVLSATHSVVSQRIKPNDG